MMKIGTLFLLSVLCAAIFGSRAALRQKGSAREKFATARAVIMTWLVSSMLLAILLFSPAKQLLLFLVPAALLATFFFKYWKGFRMRALQRAREEQWKLHFETMKRVR